MRIELEGSGSDSGSGGDSSGGGGVPAIMRNDGRGENGDGDQSDDLPTNIFNLDRVLNETPLVQAGNAFHDTLNGESLSYGDTYW